nr:MAG TPA: hypothetical protein [Caudoviricetes sp.]DAW20075.1 MAG TPA: hypothetical protein [Caudoviricetes sp.]
MQIVIISFLNILVSKGVPIKNITYYCTSSSSYSTNPLSNSLYINNSILSLIVGSRSITIISFRLCPS